MSSDLLIEVARLDGYLSGLAAVDGDIRQYTAAAFVASVSAGSDSPEAGIREVFAGQAAVQFSSSRKLPGGLAELEQQLYGYVIRAPWGRAGQGIAAASIEDRRRFVAFRIMDMIAAMASEARQFGTVHELEASASGSVSRVTFFAVRIGAGFLVLQFNDDSLVVGARIPNEPAAP